MLADPRRYSRAYVEGFADVVNRKEWDRYESRARTSTERLLDLLDETRQKATFFVLAWTAERDPELVREIVVRAGFRCLDRIGQTRYNRLFTARP